MHIDTSQTLELPLFSIARPLNVRCDRCHDTGLWVEPTGRISECPVMQLGKPHELPNLAARKIARAIDSLRFRKAEINPLAFEVAKTLSYFTSGDPCERQTLLDRHFTWTPNSVRKLQGVIEELRSVWLLPVGGRKHDPAGYWIITDADDFKAWFDEVKKAPITQLSTIHRVARANFPVFAEQMEFDFWSDMRGDDDGPDITFADADT